MTPDIVASVRARLLNRAKQRNEQFELFLVRYACERFLYRLGASEHRDQCVLKGAGLLTVWLADPYRATRDLDFATRGPGDAARVRDMVVSICAVPCSEDGLTFDLDTLDVVPIRADQEQEGQRAILRAFLGVARIRLQIDFAFGEEIPAAENAEYPTLLRGLTAPKLRIYPRVATVAEKFEAMIQLGRRNSRMKDFHDLWALSSAFTFDGVELGQAVVACFGRRGTPWTETEPDALGAAFYDLAEIAARWSDYLRAGAFQVAPPVDFGLIGERVRMFMGPLREAVVAGRPFEGRWEPGGPWR